ncbi:hypothetical protein [Breoghania sp.]|uniref:helix-turn-helix transcriptional regulator n=1 Tax=Breoghania sp. TaxID=2065378 RepID=UPI00262DE26A|nr:hypothetical protein [Breoghania sp.]MDJ0933216.1 hypothetical protein [Breoghania sp.]
MGVGIEQFGDAVRGLYEAAIEPELLAPAMEWVTDLVSASNCCLHSGDERTLKTSVMVMTRLDPSLPRGYYKDYLSKDLRIPRIFSASAGRILHGQSLSTAEERRSSPLYNEYFEPNGLHDVTGASLFVGGELSCLGFGARKDDSFDADAIKLMQFVLPHIRQAVRLHLSLQSAFGAVSELGDLWSRTGRALLLLNADGTLNYVNEAAERLIREKVVRIVYKRRVFNRSDLDGLLAGVLEAVRCDELEVGHVSQSCALLVDYAGRQIGVRFLPILGVDGRDSRLSIMLIPLDAEAAPNKVELIQFGMLFGLTPAELAVLGVLTVGEDLRGHAPARNVAHETVRKHLKNVFDKTGCRTARRICCASSSASVFCAFASFHCVAHPSRRPLTRSPQDDVVCVERLICINNTITSS